MDENRHAVGRVALSALIMVAVMVILITRLYRGDNHLLRDVMMTSDAITPNADGVTDATRLAYTLTRNAAVSIFFENAVGERFYFRQERTRGAGEYAVLFSGVVNGYVRPDEVVAGQVLARLLQDGLYTWTVEATDAGGVTERASGPLTVSEADPVLPDMWGFELDRRLFTPNQDGIDDRLLIQFDLQKEATTRVFLLTPEGAELVIGELDRAVLPGAPGRHYFDYEGGVDQGATPPPDGTYDIVALAEDAEGQKVRLSAPVVIQFGGVPRAEIVSPVSADTVQFSAASVLLCDTLTFTLTVQNYGETPIRTTGPAPGTVYDSDWNYNALGWNTESGAWRIAIGYENEISNYPFRWAVGAPDDLQMIGEQAYLMPGQRAVVTGGIRITGPLGVRNPQPIWAGLIHEDVEISEFNNRVDPKNLLIDLPDPAHIQPCPARQMPVRPPTAGR